MMQIDWNRFALLLLPLRLRTGTVYGLIKSMVAGVVNAYNALINYNADVKYKLAHTSQVWSIEAVLNDRFDLVQRRIKLVDAGGFDVTCLFPDGDIRPVILNSDSSAPFMIHQDSSYFASSYDFIVVLPYAFPEADIYELRALVNYYKLAGKRFDILVINQQ